jgi:hypothetical protein
MSGASRLSRPRNDARVDVYENIRLEQITCHKHAGMRMLFSSDSSVRKTSVEQLKQHWEISKNLRRGGSRHDNDHEDLRLEQITCHKHVGTRTLVSSRRSGIPALRS